MPIKTAREDSDNINKKNNNVNSFNQTVYHGGAKDFDRFDLTYALSGEGAMAHGYGVYTAKNKDVSEGYRKVLSGDDFDNEKYFYNGKEITDRKANREKDEFYRKYRRELNKIKRLRSRLNNYEFRLELLRYEKLLEIDNQKRKIYNNYRNSFGEVDARETAKQLIYRMGYE